MLKVTYLYLVVISVAAGVNGQNWEPCDADGKYALTFIKKLIEIPGSNEKPCSIEVKEQYNTSNQADKLLRTFLLFGIFGMEVKANVMQYYYFYAGVKRTTSEDGISGNPCITRIGLSMDPTHQHMIPNMDGTERKQNDNATEAVKALALNYATEFPYAFTEDWKEDGEWASNYSRPEDFDRDGWTRDRFWIIKGTSRVIVTYKGSGPSNIGSWSFATVAINEAGQLEFKCIGDSHYMYSKMEKELHGYLGLEDTLIVHRPWIGRDELVKEFEKDVKDFGVFERAIKKAQTDTPNFTWKDHPTEPELVEAKFLKSDWSKFLAVFKSVDEHVVIGAQQDAGTVSLLYVGQPGKGEKYDDLCEDVNNYLTLGLDQPFPKTTSYKIWSSNTFKTDYFDPIEQQVKLNGPIDIHPRAKIYLQEAGLPKSVAVPDGASVTKETAVYRYLDKFFIVAYTMDTSASSPNLLVKHIGNAENESDVINSFTTYSKFDFAYHETVFENRIGTLIADDLWQMLESSKHFIRHKMMLKLAGSFPTLSECDLAFDTAQLKVGFIPSTSSASRSPPPAGPGYGVVYCLIFKPNATTAATTRKKGLSAQLHMTLKQKALTEVRDKKFYSLVSIDFITNTWTVVHAGTCGASIDETKNVVLKYLTPQKV